MSLEIASLNLKWLLFSALVLGEASCPQDCANGGLCLPKVDSASEYACFCPPGWIGPTCSASTARAGEAVAMQQQQAPQQLQEPRRHLRAGRDAAWMEMVMDRESKVDDLIGELRTNVQEMNEASPSILNAQAPKPQGKIMLHKVHSGHGRVAAHTARKHSEAFLPYVEGTFTFTSDTKQPVDSDAFLDLFPTVLWFTLTKNFVTREDITVEAVDPVKRTITYKIVPTNPIADVKDIENAIISQMNNPTSELHDFLHIDPQASTVVATALPEVSPGTAGEVAPIEMDHVVTDSETAATTEDTSAAAAEEATPVVDDGVKQAPAVKGVQGGNDGPHKAAAGTTKVKDRIGKIGEKVASGDTIPLSTTMYCIIFLTIQFFAVYTLLKLSQTINKFSNNYFEKVESVLKDTTATVSMAPMLCVLYLGTRMRANQLGVEPQNFAKDAMMVAALSVCGQTAMTLLESIFADLIKACAGFFSLLRYVLLIGVYAGASTVCYAVVIMEANKSKYPDGPPPVAPAMQATIILTIQFFVVYLIHAICNTLNKFEVPGMAKFDAIFDMARQTVNYAPMLAILFIGTRMRALQIEPTPGPDSKVPQPWAQQCFYACSYALLAQTVLVVLIPLVGGGELKQGSTKGDVSFEIPNKGLATAVTVIRYLLMAALYGGATAVVYAVIDMKDENGKAPPVAPAMQCVTVLTTQFFLVNLVNWICITIRDLGGVDMPETIKTMQKACETAFFAPMLSVLFLGARMRSQELAGTKACPQGWVQEMMYAATAALLLQLLLIFLSGALGEGGCAAVIEFLGYVALVGLYAGIVVVVAGVVVMDPGQVAPEHCGKKGWVYFKL